MNTYHKKTVLTTAIACALGVISQQAAAVHPNVTFGSGTFKVASEHTSVADVHGFSAKNTLPTAGSGALHIYLPINNVPTGESSDYYVSITLNDGAEFIRIPTLVCSHANGMTATRLDTAPAAGSENFVGFALQSAKGVFGSTGVCTLSMSGAAATDAGGIKTTSGEKTYTMTVSAKYQGANSASYSKTAPFLTFVQGTQVTIEQNIDGQIDVRDPSFSKYFVTDTTHNPAGIKSALYLGGMKYTTAGNDIRLKDGNTFKPTNMLKTAQIVLEGLPLVAAVEGNDATGYVTLNSGHCTASKDFGTKTLIDSSGKVTLDVEADNASGLGICLWTNGETNLQKGQVTIEVSAKTSATDMTANMSHALKHLTTVTKNGTSLKILNIPDRDTTGDKPFIRLYNKGESDASVIGTMYDQDGNVIGTKDSDLLAGEKIGPKEVRILGFATIASALGVSDTGWPNQRAWMQIESDSLSLDAQGLVRTGDVLVNMSGGAEVE